MVINIDHFYVDDFLRSSPHWDEQFRYSHPRWYAAVDMQKNRDKFNDVCRHTVELIQNNDVVFAISTNKQDALFTSIIDEHADLKKLLRKKFKPAYNNNYPEDGPKLHLWVFSKHELKGEFCE